MKAGQHRSLRQRLSWWLALQSFAGLGVVCLAVYLVTEFNFRDRQRKRWRKRKTSFGTSSGWQGALGFGRPFAHKLDDFLVGHGDLSLEVARADRIVPRPHPQPECEDGMAPTAVRSSTDCGPESLKELARSAVARTSKPTTSCCTDLLSPCWSQPSVGLRCIAGRILPRQLGPGARPKTGQPDAGSVG